MSSSSRKVTPWLTAIALPLTVLAFGPAQPRQSLLSDLPAPEKTASTLAPAARLHRIEVQIGGAAAAAVISARSSLDEVGSSGAGR
jgi:hypothetical protein